jgi:hypothetical protein
MLPAIVSEKPMASIPLFAAGVLSILKVLVKVRPSAPAWNKPSWSVTVPVPTELLLVTRSMPVLIIVPPV